MMTRGMNIFEIADLLTTGDGQPITMDITLIPGHTLEDFAAYLKEKGVIKTEDEFLSLCRTGEGVSDYYFLKDVLESQNVNHRKYLLEGYLAPNTYEIYTNASPLDIIKKLLDQTDYIFHSEWQARASELGMTMDEVLTLASMIEKEAKKAEKAEK